MEGILGLIRTINIDTFLALDVTLLVVNQSIHNTITDGLTNDVFRIPLTVGLKLDTCIAERDSRVGQREHTDSGLNHIVSESKDQSPCLVSLEDCGVG